MYFNAIILICKMPETNQKIILVLATCTFNVLVAMLFLTVNVIVGENGEKTVSEMIDLSFTEDSIQNKSTSLAMAMIIQGSFFVLHCGAFLVLIDGSMISGKDCEDFPWLSFISGIAVFVFIWLSFIFGSICLSCSYENEETCHIVSCGTASFFLFAYYFTTIVAARKHFGFAKNSEDGWIFFVFLFIVTSVVIFFVSIFLTTFEAWTEYFLMCLSGIVEIFIVYACSKALEPTGKKV